MKLTDLSEGIVARTSQHDKRTEAAIDLFAHSLNNDPDRVDELDSAFITLSAFLDVGQLEELDWFFRQTFSELNIQPNQQAQMKEAMIYIAQRYNQQLENTGNASVWYYALLQKLRDKIISN